jgi:hypothetical protein
MDELASRVDAAGKDAAYAKSLLDAAYGDGDVHAILRDRRQETRSQADTEGESGAESEDLFFEEEEEEEEEEDEDFQEPYDRSYYPGSDEEVPFGDEEAVRATGRIKTVKRKQLLLDEDDDSAQATGIMRALSRIGDSPAVKKLKGQRESFKAEVKTSAKDSFDRREAEKKVQYLEAKIAYTKYTEKKEKGKATEDDATDARKAIMKALNTKIMKQTSKDDPDKSEMDGWKDELKPSSLSAGRYVRTKARIGIPGGPFKPLAPAADPIVPSEAEDMTPEAPHSLKLYVGSVKKGANVIGKPDRDHAVNFVGASGRMETGDGSVEHLGYEHASSGRLVGKGEHYIITNAGGAATYSITTPVDPNHVLKVTTHSLAAGKSATWKDVKTDEAIHLKDGAAAKVVITHPDDDDDQVQNIGVDYGKSGAFVGAGSSYTIENEGRSPFSFTRVVPVE